MNLNKPYKTLLFLIQVGELSQELKELPMRALLAAAFITYMSAASEVRLSV